MSDGEANEWLSVGAQTLMTYSLPSIARACADARRECTHYREIVSFVAKACEADRRNDLRLSQATSPQPRLPKPRLSREDFDRIVAERGTALSVALDRGTIIRTETGFERA